MAKSFCSGCNNWKVAKTFDRSKFHYCSILETHSLFERKFLCNGKYKKSDMAKETKASECKCRECNKQAVAFYPCIDPDIPSYPYCADHLEKAMIDVARTVWKDDEGMQAVAIYQAREAVKKYR